jgi:FKBP-type peptidyl-prolyl cis-trans isomerase
MKMWLARVVLHLAVAVAVAGLAPKPSQQGSDTLVTLPSGLKYIDMVMGTGAEAKMEQTVRVYYTFWLKDGTLIAVLDRAEPHAFRLGGGQVIKGLSEGVVGMKAGGRRRLMIPPKLA